MRPAARRQRQRGILGIPSGPTAWVIVGLVVALLLSWGASGLMVRYFDAKLDRANKDIAAAKAAYSAEKESRNQFQSSAAACSASVDALVRAAAAQAGDDAKARAASKAKTAAVQAEVAKLLAERAAAGETPCQHANREANDEIHDRHPAQ